MKAIILKSAFNGAYFFSGKLRKSFKIEKLEF